MLRQVFIARGEDLIYKRYFANALSDDEIRDMCFRIRNQARKKIGQNIGFFDYVNYKISYNIYLHFVNNIITRFKGS